MSNYPNLSTDEIETLTYFFYYVDSDHDGYITTTEIADACAVDYNQDGTIDTEERAKAALPWLSSTALQDFDGDTKLSLNELLKYNNDNKNM